MLFGRGFDSRRLHQQDQLFSQIFWRFCVSRGPNAAALLGHSDVSVTSRYLGAAPQRAEAVAALARLPGPGGSPEDQRGQLHRGVQRLEQEEKAREFAIS